MSHPARSTDPLSAGPESPDRLFPDRLFYAPGVLLDAVDLQAEQLYHRGRLARALAYLHGHGTVSGLRVIWQPPLAPGDRDPATDREYPEGREEHLLVQPGLAIDRLGRLIELPRAACLRLNRWFEQQQRQPPELIQSFHPQPDTPAADTAIGRTDPPAATPLTVSAAAGGVVVDVFLHFHLCETGKTPAFAAGPFDATDAAVPARLRDAYEIQLVLRQEATVDLAANLPQSPWASATDLSQLQTALFDSWQEDTADWDAQGRPVPLSEHTTNQDTTAVFLARLLLPAVLDTSGLPQRTTAPVQLDNHSRRFVYPTSALTRWLQILTPPTNE